MTKSIVKAKDYDVKIKFDGVEQFIGLEDIKINGKPLKTHIENVEKLIIDLKVLEEVAFKSLQEKDIEINILNKAVKELQATVKKLVEIERLGIEKVLRKWKNGFLMYW